MAQNKITPSNINSSAYFNATSRYRNYDIIYYGEENYITLPTYKKIKREPNAEDKFLIITKGLEYRPDLLSFDTYGTPDYWWRILEANNMMDIDEFKVGTNILVPNANTL